MKKFTPKDVELRTAFLQFWTWWMLRFMKSPRQLNRLKRAIEAITEEK